VVEAEESAEIPYYQRSSASIRGSVFLLTVKVATIATQSEK
jgi:hypothetical protein